MTDAYLDTNIASGLAKNDLDQAETDALEQLLEMPESKLQLCTSRLMEDELARIPAAHGDLQAAEQGAVRPRQLPVAADHDLPSFRADGWPDSS